MIFPCISRESQRVLDLEGEGFKGVKTLALERTNLFDAVQSFLPLFATFGESQTIQENQLLNVTEPCATTCVTSLSSVGEHKWV